MFQSQIPLYLSDEEHPAVWRAGKPVRQLGHPAAGQPGTQAHVDMHSGTQPAEHAANETIWHVGGRPERAGEPASQPAEQARLRLVPSQWRRRPRGLRPGVSFLERPRNPKFELHAAPDEKGRGYTGRQARRRSQRLGYTLADCNSLLSLV